MRILDVRFKTRYSAASLIVTNLAVSAVKISKPRACASPRDSSTWSPRAIYTTVAFKLRRYILNLESVGWSKTYG